MTDPLLRSAPAPIRGAALCLALLVALGIVSLITVLVQGGSTGFGLVATVLAVFALLNVRRVGDGNRAARAIATVLCVVLAAYRAAYLYLIAAYDIDADPTVLALTIGQLALELLLVVAALVLLHRPAVTSHLQRR